MVAPGSSPAEPYGDLQSTWMTLFGAGRTSEAFLIAQRAAAQYPAEPLGAIGSCWFHMQNSADSVFLAAAEALSRLLPGAYDTFYFRSRALERMGLTDDLEQTFEAAIRVHPGRKLGWLGLAQCLEQRGELVRCLDTLRTALTEVQPDELDAVIEAFTRIRSQHPAALTREAFDAVVSAGKRAPATVPAVTDWLFGKAAPAERASLLDGLEQHFPGNDNLYHLGLRLRFDQRDFSIEGDRFVAYALRQQGSLAFKLLWAERLLGVHDFKGLAEHLTANRLAFSQPGLGMAGGLLLLDAIYNCRAAGFEPGLTYGDVQSGDTRIGRAVQAYLAGDPFLHLRDPGNDAPAPAFRRVNSFIHQGWNIPLGGFHPKPVTDLVIQAIVDRAPFCLIRLGDGEGNFLRGHTRTLINATLYVTPDHKHANPEVAPAEYDALRADFLDGIAEADVVGIPNEFMVELAEELTFVNRTLATLPLRGVLTDNHVHYALAADGCFERAIAMQLLARLPVIYIGPHAPATFEGLAVPTRAFVHWAIPGEAVYLAETLQQTPHYPDHYHAILARIAELPDKALVLISAGLLGKLYAVAIRRRGGIALDIGAVSDHWAGRRTRIYSNQDGPVSANATLLELVDQAAGPA